MSGQPLIEAQLLDLIGRIRTQVGDYDEARPVLTEALAIRRRELGEEHPDVATSLVNLAALMNASDASDSQAIPLLERATAVRTRVFGVHDPRTTDAMYALASVRHMSGDRRGAKALFESWFAAIQGQPPQLTPARATQLAEFSTMLDITGQFDGAERLAREVITLDRALYGPSHVRVALALSHLGSILSDEGRMAAADSALRESVALLRNSFPGGHAELAGALRGLGNLLTEEQQWSEADTVWHEAAAMYLKTQGDASLGYANASTQVGDVQVARADYAGAERTLRTALKLGAIVRAPSSPIAVRGRTYLGEALRAQGRLQEAEPLLLDGYRQRTLARGVREFAAAALVKLYEADGRSDEAAKYRVVRGR